MTHCCFAGCRPLACGCCANTLGHEPDCPQNPLCPPDVPLAGTPVWCPSCMGWTDHHYRDHPGPT